MNDPHGNNVARHLRIAALEQPDAWATKTPLSIGPQGTVSHARCSFRQLDQESDAAARIFHAEGIHQGCRVLLALRPGHDLIVGMFGLLKIGAVPIAIDPGMGWKNFLSCVSRSQPTALVGIRTAILLSYLPFTAFDSLEIRVKVGTTRWRHLVKQCLSNEPRPLANVAHQDLAAILFTSGSTGKPKGVPYTHGMFDAQISLVQKTFGIQPGEVDMPMLQLFALFNPALRMTSVTPILDPSRPASANPAPIVAALQAEKVTNSFGSPAIWSLIAEYCLRRNLQLPSLRRLLIAGAPVPDRLLEQLQKIAPQCQINTPYGATECLPVSTITAPARLEETKVASLQGHGTCVGLPVSGVKIKIIRSSEGVIAKLTEATVCGPDEVGEIIVTGPHVTREYDDLPKATAAAKIYDQGEVWHRMGDLGKIDAQGRLWFLGRKAERVTTSTGVLYTEAIEPVFRTHPQVARCALIGIGQAPHQEPYLVIEPRTGNMPQSSHDRLVFANSLQALADAHSHTAMIKGFLFQKKLPVDVRHNAKIHRLELSNLWTQKLQRVVFTKVLKPRLKHD
jgi:acyl-CoA synthetase (AMP-forming)/AMP-acid ligase II